MESRLEGDISFADVARECRLSRSHFARAFKQSTGFPPHRWLQQRRVEHARDLLLKDKLTLAEIAVRCGFADQSHFNRVFLSHAGTTPGTWRRRHRSAPAYTPSVSSHLETACI
ncbi:helix-turn-helix domain-containing protein [Acidisoma cellulosilyticum]